jgi:hypothetical protein
MRGRSRSIGVYHLTGIMRNKLNQAKDKVTKGERRIEVLDGYGLSNDKHPLLSNNNIVSQPPLYNEIVTCASFIYPWKFDSVIKNLHKTTTVSNSSYGSHSTAESSQTTQKVDGKAVSSEIQPPIFSRTVTSTLRYTHGVQLE